MKKTIISIVCAIFTIFSLSSCYSYYYGAAFSQSNIVGKNEAHGKSSTIVFLQLFGGSGGSIQKAALDGRIDSIYRVEYEKSVILGGLIGIRTTHVYGSSSNLEKKGTTLENKRMTFEKKNTTNNSNIKLEDSIYQSRKKRAE